jgi:hypothetical protein
MRSKPVLAVLALVILLGVIFGLYRDHRLDSNFPAVKPKAPESEVRALMGNPSKIDHSCSAYGTVVTENCDHVFVYRSSFGPVRSRYWLVFFDANQQATATSKQAEP